MVHVQVPVMADKMEEMCLLAMTVTVMMNNGRQCTIDDQKNVAGKVQEGPA